MPEPFLLFAQMNRMISIEAHGIEQLRKISRISSKAKVRSLQSSVGRVMAGTQFMTPVKAHDKAYAKILSGTIFPQEVMGKIEGITLHI